MDDWAHSLIRETFGDGFIAAHLTGLMNGEVRVTILEQNPNT
jgi:hypothetical protein